MTDGDTPVLTQVARLGRRRLLGAVAGGALIGSAWAAALRDAVTAGDDVLVTVARTATALGVLYEHHGHRIMLIDAADGPGTIAVTELAAGFMRQRIDAVLMTTDTAASLPRDYSEEWSVRDVWALPDQKNNAPSSLAGKSLRVGDLVIEIGALPLGAWRTDASPKTDWYVAATRGRAGLTVTSDGDAIPRLPLDTAMANAIVCNDVGLDLGVVPAGINALVVPVEAAESISGDVSVVALSRNESATFRLRGDQIDTP